MNSPFNFFFCILFCILKFIQFEKKKVSRWISIPLVEMAFGEAATRASVTNSSCLNGFNCLLSGQDALMRMTVRRWAMKPNPDEILGKRISPFVFPESILKPGSQGIAGSTPQTEIVPFDENFQLVQPIALSSEDSEWEFERVCNYQDAAAGDRGYNGYGGWVCILSDNQNDFKKSVGAVANQLTAPLSVDQPYVIGSIIIEFVSYNPNVDMTTFVRITFDSDGTGKMKPDLEIYRFDINKTKFSVMSGKRIFGTNFGPNFGFRV